MKDQLTLISMVLALSTSASWATTVDQTGYGIVHNIAPLCCNNGLNATDDGTITSINLSGPAAPSSLNPGLTTAALRGDLSTGEVGASSSINSASTIRGASPFASVELVDTLTFDLSGLGADETVDLDVGISWEGSIKPGFSLSGDDFARLDFGLGSADDTLRVVKNVIVDTFRLPLVVPDFELGDSFSLESPATSVSFTGGSGLIGDWDAESQPFARKTPFNGIFTLQGGKVTEVDFRMGLTVAGNADYFNSAHLSFFSPVDFTSASGVFMSSTSTGGGTGGGDTGVPAVPLPSSGLLLLAGLGVFAARRKLR